MARGWESKSVEDQIQARDSSPQRVGSAPSPESLRLQAKQIGLQLVRTRTLTALQTCCDSRRRAHLERVLADVDAQLSSLLENSHQ
jgi:hypothetical protein